MSEQERYEWAVKLAEASEKTIHAHPDLSRSLAEAALALLEQTRK